jgi:hypothetical protein
MFLESEEHYAGRETARTRKGMGMRWPRPMGALAPLYPFTERKWRGVPHFSSASKASRCNGTDAAQMAMESKRARAGGIVCERPVSL